jgi:tripartite-type tricarboxylate transporter receptor subunit TctC
MVPFAAGGLSDILGRVVAAKMGEVAGQTVIVENRGGAGGTIGAAIVAAAEPDGYMVMLSSLTTQAIAPHMLQKVPYNTLTAFTPVAGVALSPNIISVGASLPVRSVKDLIAYAKANPGKLAYGSSGQGSVGHLTGEILRSLAGVDMTHVPFKSAGLAYPDVAAGNLQMVIDTLPSALQHIKAGTVRPVALLSPRRAGVLPDVPTIAEAGLPGYEMSPWIGVFAPAGTPRPVIDRLNREINATLALPEVVATLGKQALDPAPTTVDEFNRILQVDFEKYGKLIALTGARVEWCLSRGREEARDERSERRDLRGHSVRRSLAMSGSHDEIPGADRCVHRAVPVARVARGPR